MLLSLLAWMSLQTVTAFSEPCQICKTELFNNVLNIPLDRVRKECYAGPKKLSRRRHYQICLKNFTFTAQLEGKVWIEKQKFTVYYWILWVFFIYKDKTWLFIIFVVFLDAITKQKTIRYAENKLIFKIKICANFIDILEINWNSLN